MVACPVSQCRSIGLRSFGRAAGSPTNELRYSRTSSFTLVRRSIATFLASRKSSSCITRVKVLFWLPPRNLSAWHMICGWTVSTCDDPPRREGGNVHVLPTAPNICRCVRRTACVNKSPLAEVHSSDPREIPARSGSPVHRWRASAWDRSDRGRLWGSRWHPPSTPPAPGHV